MIHEHHVAAGDADVGQQGALRRRPDRGEAEREGQRVGHRPLDHDDRRGDLDLGRAALVWFGVVARSGHLLRVGLGNVHALAKERVVAGPHAGEPHGVAMGGIGVGGVAGARPHYLLEDQHIAGPQVAQRAHQPALRDAAGLVVANHFPPVLQGRRGCAAREAALGVAPGVERDGIMGLVEVELAALSQRTRKHLLEQLAVRAAQLGTAQRQANQRQHLQLQPGEVARIVEAADA